MTLPREKAGVPPVVLSLPRLGGSEILSDQPIKPADLFLCTDSGCINIQDFLTDVVV